MTSQPLTLPNNKLLFIRFIIALVGFSLLTFLAYQQLKQPELGIDDAHIFFVYGQNIVNEQAIVYNVGGERVEGYTSPLWLVFVTIASLFPAALTGILLVLSLLIIAGVITLIWHYLDEDQPITWRGALFLAWALSSPTFVTWMTLTLMDTVLWMGILSLSTITVLAKRPKLLPLAVFLLVLARPEGMLWSLLFISLYFLRSLIENGWRDAWQTSRLSLATYIITLAVLIGGRLLYFGYPLPNTYYAKVSPDFGYNIVSGLVYLRSFFQENFIPLILSWLFVTVFLVKSIYLLRQFRSRTLSKTEITQQVILLSSHLIFVAGLLFPVLTGGDHFAHSRFYQPIWLIFLLPVFIQFSNWQPPQTIRYIVVSLAIILFFVTPRINWLNFANSNDHKVEFEIATRDKRIGHMLNELFPMDSPTIGVIAAGGIAYTYEGDIFDTMGLNNLTVAHTEGDRYGEKNHAAFNQELFLQERPELFLVETFSTPSIDEKGCHDIGRDLIVWPNSTLKGLLEAPEFWQVYERVVLRQGSVEIITYVEKGYLEQLPTKGIDVEVIDCYS